jgi:hypothetical protein
MSGLRQGIYCEQHCTVVLQKAVVQQTVYLLFMDLFPQGGEGDGKQTIKARKEKEE